jgi:hypothetical protein
LLASSKSAGIFSAVEVPGRLDANKMPTEKISSNDFCWTLADEGAGGAVLKPCFYGFWWMPADVAGSQNGARGRNRTTDTRIFNPLLYP